ncbi:AtpZ/AtpI family protein [Echinicola pacifica]|uniref:AtpZ/AtpI family protein n=1 Tax=Echinicola pacifica TaxID=346377 RepID=UPI00039EC7B9|nr:AtpZ/AtpI family protein [Echinicola pacifica]
MKKQENNPEKKSSPTEYPEYIKYIGLAFQMFAIIGGGTYLGYIIQERSEMKFPVWLLLFCLVSIVIAFYSIFVSLKKK